ncbi:hypothetical protein N7457_006979 [Penicillium paradoxum]|uniref:uncharacterized protein n=1 Tax=Penicillium paradoxum TaxID=176176 RepID=UPI0025485F0C|nr:uncharacterized protein N7457_006979 [Penicillium paradoxum]KAJ5779259.1 hypothetical protein N7457_006979 [Penicillium paradoxum]
MQPFTQDCLMYPHDIGLPEYDAALLNTECFENVYKLPELPEISSVLNLNSVVTLLTLRCYFGNAFRKLPMNRKY